MANPESVDDFECNISPDKEHMRPRKSVHSSFGDGSIKSANSSFGAGSSVANGPQPNYSKNYKHSKDMHGFEFKYGLK